MNKKLLPLVIGILVILVVGGGVVAYLKSKAKPAADSTATTKKKITVSVNIIPVEQRPYAQMVPSPDGHNIIFRVISLKLPADSVDYDVEYQTGTLLQGFSETLSLGTLPAEKATLMGTRSAGGATTYNTDIQGGTITAKFGGKGNDYGVKTDWRFFENKTKDKSTGSRDDKFQLTADALAKTKFLVVFSGFGFPDGLTGTAMSAPYGLAADIPLAGKAQISIKANDVGATKIMGYDGSAWHDFTAKVGDDGKTLTADVDLMPFYIAVK